MLERTQKLEEVARPFGLYCDTPDRAAHYLCLTLPDDAPGNMAQALLEKGVSISQRGHRLRITPHLYNDDADIERFGAALAAILS